MNILNWLFKHNHKWKATAVNKWQIPTKQECKCGISREVHSQPDSRNIASNFFWYYSDGAIKPDERVFKHT